MRTAKKKSTRKPTRSRKKPAGKTGTSPELSGPAADALHLAAERGELSLATQERLAAYLSQTSGGKSRSGKSQTRKRAPARKTTRKRRS